MPTNRLPDFNSVIPGAQRQANTATSTAAGSRSQYLSSLEGFDPRAYLADAAGSAYSGLQEQMGQATANRRQSLARRGLFGADLGAGRQQKDFSSRLAQALASLSMEAGGMEQRRQGMIGDVYRGDQQNAQVQQGQYYDLLAGAQDRQQAEKNAKKSRWSSLAGGLGALAGGAIGTFLLPGIGTELGASLGGGLGSGVGGMF